MQALRIKDDALPNTTPHFNVHPLDRLIDAVDETKPQTSYTKKPPPIIELSSIAPGGGKSHLLYHLTALAILSTHHAGNQACVIILDTDNAFSITRLANQLKLLLIRNAGPETETSEAPINETILSALLHVHIFRPQSLASLIATLDSLPTYLFDKTKHYSFDREVAFVAIDSLSTFYWQDRAETEDAAFLATTTTTTLTKPQAAYSTLSTSLKVTTITFTCPAIVTNWHLGPHQQERSFRPTLPGLSPALRLVVERLPVRKFPPGIGIEQAQREAEDRQKAVDEAKFECTVNDWGVDERVLRKLQAAGSRFIFQINAQGVVIDDRR